MDKNWEYRSTIDARTREETAPQALADFPYRAGVDPLSDRPGGTFPWHWHPDVELVWVRRGALEYHLPGGSARLEEDDIGFVNAGVLHMTRAAGLCRLQEHIFLPGLVAGAPGGGIERRYVAPLLENAAADFLRVPANAPEGTELRALFDRAFRAYAAREPGCEIEIRACMSRAWLLLLRFAPEPVQSAGDIDGERVKAMLRYIETHYDQPIALSDIAAAAHIGAREANRCFRRQLDATPFETLLDCRLRQACRLLRETRLPVTEIGLRCGFSAASYFGKRFREAFGCAPSEYRKWAKEAL